MAHVSPAALWAKWEVWWKLFGMQKILKFFRVNNSGGKINTHWRTRAHTQNVLLSSDQTEDKLVVCLKSRFSFRLTCQHLLLSLLFPVCNAEGRYDVLLRSPEQSGRSGTESAAECFTGVAYKKKTFHRFCTSIPIKLWRQFLTRVPR